MAAKSMGLQLKYFVLNPAEVGAYGRASKEALVAYANAIRNANPLLATDIMIWVNRILSPGEVPSA
jgi:hypothetical protein